MRHATVCTTPARGPRHPAPFQPCYDLRVIVQPPIPPPGYVPAPPPATAPAPQHEPPAQTPRPGALRALPQLVAPVWGQQPSESPEAFRAFVAGLQAGPSAFELTRGGKAEGQGWTLAQRASGAPSHWLAQTSELWAWPTRAREYWSHVRRLAYDAAQPLREQLEAMQAQRARTHQLALDLEELELRKLLMRAKGEDAPAGSPESLPEQLDVRALARLRQVNASVSEQLRREAAGIAPDLSSAGGDDGIAWDKLSDAEAEEYRQLRSKAGLG